MKHVCIYMFRARYRGGPGSKPRRLEPGAMHKCLLFLAQDHGNIDIREALGAVRKLGFTDISDMRGSLLDPGLLDSPEYGEFAPHYDAALNAGYSLLCYPPHASADPDPGR